MLYQFHYCFIAVKHIFKRNPFYYSFKMPKILNFLSRVTVTKSRDITVCNDADKLAYSCKHIYKYNSKTGEINSPNCVSKTLCPVLPSM